MHPIPKIITILLIQKVSTLNLFKNTDAQASETYNYN